METVASTLIVTFALIHSNGNWLDCHAIWGLIHVIINISRVLKDYYSWFLASRQYSVEDKVLQTEIFENYPSSHFAEIWHKYKWTMKNPGDLIMLQDQPVTKLFLLYMGEAEIIVDDVLVAVVQKGQFLGELSYFTQEDATATVRAKTVCQLISFDMNEVRHGGKSHDHTVKSQALAMLPSLFCRDMAKKMTMDNHHTKQKTMFLPPGKLGTKGPAMARMAAPAEEGESQEGREGVGGGVTRGVELRKRPAPLARLAADGQLRKQVSQIGARVVPMGKARQKRLSRLL